MLPLILFASLAFAAPSAKRAPGHSYREYMSDRALMQVLPPTVEQTATPWPQFKLPSLPRWPEGETQRRFESLRDTRWLDDGAHKNFARRLAWLYPDDGCFARA